MDLIITAFTALIVGTIYYLLLQALATEVDIYFQGETIKFKTKYKVLSLAPVLHISKLRKRSRLLGVGRDFQAKEPSYQVDLFNYEESDSDRDKITKLTNFYSVFFRHSFIQLLERKFLLFTKVNVYGINTINQKTEENIENVVIKALKLAGSVKFNVISTH
jgi:hypothetical protein